MNPPVIRLFGLVVVLFAVLVASRRAGRCSRPGAARQPGEQARAILEEQRIKRGAIRAADGRVLARSVRGPGDTLRAPLPGRRAVRATRSATRTSTSAASGHRALPQRRADRPADELVTASIDRSGRSSEGDDVRTTLDPAAQQIAIAALAGRKGAVVALDARTGAVR